LSVDGPGQTNIHTSDNGNGSCSVTYVPLVKGSYKINVLLDDQHVAGEFAVDCKLLAAKQRSPLVVLHNANYFVSFCILMCEVNILSFIRQFSQIL
jgi:Filamin/ABP280 repeat